MTNHDLAFQALGDPTRRAIMDRLSAGPAPVGKIAIDLPVTRSAVSQHLRVLMNAGLVVVHHRGTRNFYEIDP